MGKKSKKKRSKDYVDVLGGDSTWENHPELHGVIKEENYRFLDSIAHQTVKLLGKEWQGNVKHNKKFWEKHSPLAACTGLAKNKATIAIGAGQSFNINKEVVKEYVNHDMRKDWHDRDFVVIAANHQFKPLMEMNVVPDFILLVDASDVVMEQLCKDIPPEGQNTTLITGVHCNPKVIEEWTKQGRGILFYLSAAPSTQEEFKKHIGKNPKKYKIDLGGNVLNGAWMISAAVFHSTVFMGVGNDLSFPIKKTIEEQRSSYYADGDYSSNAPKTGTGRDEANTHRQWAGFSLKRKQIVMPGSQRLSGIDRYDIELDLIGTSKTLWVYKNWLEIHILKQAKYPAHLHYFNCSEGGILGVMARDDSSPEVLKKDDNWYMLDSIIKNEHTGATQYHTAIFEDAAEHFMKVRRLFLCQLRENLVKNSAPVGAVGLAALKEAITA